MPQPLTSIASEEIRVELTRQRRTGADLARELGVSTSWVHYRLSGRQEIGLTDLERIAGALDIPVVRLLGDGIFSAPGASATAASHAA
jgi:transcriptional regulator with XRE-family HTH domain